MQEKHKLVMFLKKMMELMSAKKSVIFAFGIIFLTAIAVNYLAIPNMLSHDQLNNEILLMRADHPEFFVRDPLFGNGSYLAHYSPFIDFLRFINRFTGGSEYSYRLFVPISFFFFVFGMFLLISFSFEGTPFFVRLGVALVSAIPFHVMQDDFGIPGPSQMVARFITFPFYPYLLLLWYRYAKTPLEYGIFFAVGVLGIIHQVSAFYVAEALLLASLFLYGLNRKNFIRFFLSGIFFLLGFSPFILQHFVRYPAPSVTLPGDAYIFALWMAHSHMNPLWMKVIYEKFFFERWYLVWPFVVVTAGMLWLRKKRGIFSALDRMSIAFLAAILMVTVGTTLYNQFLQLVLQIKPTLVNEPRAFQFAYFIFYMYLGGAIGYGWNFAVSQFWKHKRIAVSFFLLALAAAGFTGYRVARHIELLLYGKYHYTETAATCRLPLYAWVEKNTLVQSLFLTDPDYYLPFRICAKRSVAYAYKDSSLAIRTNYLVEWTKRKHIVHAAYAAGFAQIEDVAQRYGADYVVSRDCIKFPDLKKLYQDPLSSRDCVYAMPRLWAH